MGLFEDLFSTTGSPREESPPRGVFESIFSGGEDTSRSDGFFGGSSLGSYQEPIIPTGSQVRGYGGSYHQSVSAADKSCLMDGVVTDPDTGYVGTPAQIYDKYIAEGRNPSRLVQRFHKW